MSQLIILIFNFLCGIFIDYTVFINRLASLMLVKPTVYLFHHLPDIVVIGTALHNRPCISRMVICNGVRCISTFCRHWSGDAFQSSVLISEIQNNVTIVTVVYCSFFQLFIKVLYLYCFICKGFICQKIYLLRYCFLFLQVYTSTSHNNIIEYSGICLMFPPDHWSVDCIPWLCPAVQLQMYNSAQWQGYL